MAEPEHFEPNNTPVHVSPVLDELGNEPHFPSSKSVENMESIILESSTLDDDDENGTGDEGDNLALETEDATQALDDLQLTQQEAEIVTSTPMAKQPAMREQHPTVADTSNVAKPLAQYFGEPDADGGSGDFFDTLENIETTPVIAEEIEAAKIVDEIEAFKETEKEETLSEEVEGAMKRSQSKSVTFAADRKDTEEEEEDNEEEPVQQGQRTRIRTISASEEIPVAFEESKGGHLPATPSTKNLSKFFTEDGAAEKNGTEGDGSSFFDSFTVSESGTGPATAAQHGFMHSVSQDSQSESQTDSLPPETPPIPGSSPFHNHPPTRLPSGDDVFSASLRTSDEDRRYDAWIPSEHTQQILAHLASCAPGTYVPEPDHLTMPGVIVDEPLGDPVRELVRRCCGDQEAHNRHTLTPDSVPRNEDGLRQLISAECFRAAVDLTTLLLTECGQGVKALNSPSPHTPYSLQLWFVRLSLFMKLRLYAHADSECQAFGNLDRPDLYYEFYRDAYPGRRGSMVPFEMRVIHATLPLYLGKTQESLDRLYYLHAIATQILENLRSGLAEDGSMITLPDESRTASKKLWEHRENELLYSKVNCLLNIKDYSTALQIFDVLLKKDTSHKTALLSAVARTYLQMGDVEKAQEYFDQAEKRPDVNTDNFTKSRLHMNKGFTALGKGAFSEAQSHFKQAIEADPTNIVAINNMAVSSLYNGKLKEALSTLENLVNSDPTKYLQEGILFNLCTLYELESSHAANKKKKLLNLVSQHKGNGFNVSCLKLT